MTHFRSAREMIAALHAFRQGPGWAEQDTDYGCPIQTSRHPIGHYLVLSSIVFGPRASGGAALTDGKTWRTLVDWARRKGEDRPKLSPAQREILVYIARQAVARGILSRPVQVVQAIRVAFRSGTSLRTIPLDEKSPLNDDPTQGGEPCPTIPTE